MSKNTTPDQLAAGAGSGTRTLDGAHRPVLEARHLVKHFSVRGNGIVSLKDQVLHAVDDVSLNLYPGEVSGLVGESGCGKSTLTRMLAMLEQPTSGEVLLRGETVHAKRGRAFREYVGNVQMVLQDPFGSFNPLQTIQRHIERVIRIHENGAKATAAQERLAEVLTEVSLTPPQQFAEKYPHELSGGQRQRASIARALAARPQVLLADEPVSSLDVSIRLGILNLLGRLASELNVALLYVTHDIATARYFAKNTSVMYAGQLIESGSSEDVTQNAKHPYTQLLLSSAPDPDRPADRKRIEAIGQPPSLITPPSGCRFHPRCPFAMEKCKTTPPPRFDVGSGQWARCWLYEGSPELSADAVEAPSAADATASAAASETPAVSTPPAAPKS
jgi:peptide/nickel transport system ATP-binding protein